MDNHKVTNQEDCHRPHHRTDRIGRKLLEVISHEGWVAMQFAHDAGIHILQAPARNHRIVTGNQEAREHLQVAYPLPSRSIGGGVIPCLRNIDRKSE